MKESRKKTLTRYKIPLAALILLILAVATFASLKSATVQAKENLMDGVAPQQQEIPETPGADFVSAQADFAVELFQKSASGDKNALISPASAALALGMTANGAKGNTLSQFESLLGNGMDLADLNKNFASEAALLKSVKEGKLLLADSIWYRDKNLAVEKPFLQANADFFGADAFRLDFSDPATPGKINAWVSKNTDGKIEKMVETIDPDNAMFLINTLYLEQDWQAPYGGSGDRVFHTPDGDRTVKMMDSTETYLHGEGAQGILKPLSDPRYAFAAILPADGPSLSDYLSGLTGEKFLSLMRSAGDEKASSSLPKFKFDCTLTLNDALISLGLSDAFDGNKADFSAMGRGEDGNLFVSAVLHKTFIEVDELGVKAGAATEVTMDLTSAPMRSLAFDRPFVFAIVDTQALLPVFLGTVADPAA